MLVAALRAHLHKSSSSVACMTFLAKHSIPLSQKTPNRPFSSNSNSRQPIKETHAQVMAGPWLRRALAWTASSRPFAIALGATAAGTGVWMTHNSQWWQQRRLFHKNTSALTQRSVQANLSVDHNNHNTGNDTQSSSSSSSPQPKLLILTSAAALIPHPAKEDKGGEDAYFICDTGMCIGVADGVGGWAEIGVDPGLYSRELMHNAGIVTASIPPGPDVPQKALEIAHARTTARGSTTACIVCIHEGRLFASNLGDSGFLVVRDGELAFMSPQQQHEFNFPYQIGSADSMADMPSAAQRFDLDVAAGDIIVVATDGVFDNVYPDEAASLVALSKKTGKSPEQAATTLAKFARTRAADPAHLSPFAYGAQQLGFRYFGGKMDDITVVVGFVVAGDDSKDNGGSGGGEVNEGGKGKEEDKVPQKPRNKL